MHTLHVELGKRRYPIYIGENLLSSSAWLSSHISATQLFLITNDTLKRLYMNSLQIHLSHSSLTVYSLKEGEQYKTLETLNTIFDTMLESGQRRDTMVLALGGGVVGDIAGFAAACYQRGVSYLQIPTSLLAQVDSSVGGKTAVNHPLGKNMIGAFHQPSAVIIDIATLATLPDREFRSGLAEVIKYGLIYDTDFFHWLRANMTDILNKQADYLIPMIKRSCEIKAAIVASDETDQLDRRALLNLGHTFGHAIEQLLGYGTWLHGEAVSVGIMISSYLSLQLGFIAKDEIEQIKRVLQSANLPIKLPPHIETKSLYETMQRDKKAEKMQLPLILLNTLGQACVYREASSDQIIIAIDNAR